MSRTDDKLNLILTKLDAYHVDARRAHASAALATKACGKATRDVTSLREQLNKVKRFLREKLGYQD